MLRHQQNRQALQEPHRNFYGQNMDLFWKFHLSRLYGIKYSTGINQAFLPDENKHIHLNHFQRFLLHEQIHNVHHGHEIRPGQQKVQSHFLCAHHNTGQTISTVFPLPYINSLCKKTQLFCSLPFMLITTNFTYILYIENYHYCKRSST